MDWTSCRLRLREITDFKITVALLALIFTGAMLGGVLLTHPPANTVAVIGEIQDSACGGTASHVDSRCARLCVRNGAHWVLYQPSTETVYELDDQTTPAAFAAEEVTVKGSLDRKMHRIHVANITRRTQRKPRNRL